MEHHGILGMRWGVRRYQNADGSLTTQGKNRYKKVSSSERLQKRETRKAKRTLRKESAHTKQAAKTYDRSARMWERKANRYFQRDKKKRQSSYTAAKYRAMADHFYTQSDIMSKALKDIKSGTKKAGKDFITQTDFNFYPFLITKKTSVILKSNN